MTQAAVSMKDVLREMKELKPGSANPTDETYDEAYNKAESEPQDDDDLCDDDLGNDLSPEEMKIAQLAIVLVSETLVVIKELIRTITGMLKLENPNDSGHFVDCLEKLLKLTKGIGAQIDELGACLYPPQEVPAMKAASEKISKIIDDMLVELGSLGGTSQAFLQACDGLRNSLRKFQYELDCPSTADLEEKLQDIALSN